MTTQINGLLKPWGLLQRYPNFIFWGAFLTLNALLFLPFTLLNFDEAFSQNFLATLQNAPLTALFNLFVWRQNIDPFRINSELVVMLALWLNIAWLRRGAIQWFMAALYFTALFYYLYESIMVYLYKAEPVFYNHYFLIRDGLSFLTDHLNISIVLYLGMLIGAAILIAIIISLIRALVDGQLPTRVSRATRLVVLAMAAAVLLSAATYGDVSADPRMVASSLTFKLEKNIAASVALYESIINFDDAEIYTTYNYRKHDLTTKPNVYLLAIESYGTVLYKRPDYLVAYAKMLNQMQQRLQERDFHYASTVSESPTWGGGSWLAYTSALYGLRIENHPQYLTLMDRYQTVTPRYPDLGTYLRGQGYHYFWTTSISEELSDSKWQQYQRFYGTDEWLRYSDLDYDGSHYGWGPVPPDQYVLAYTRDEAMKDKDQPLFMFYITQNSHFPYDPLPTMAKDWHDLDVPLPDGDPVAVAAADHSQLRARYLESIGYELEMLTDFIINHADENAVFVLIGDHQPPGVSRRADSYETPLHIISQDSALIDNLDQYGFVKSLNIHSATSQVDAPKLHHEGIYSLLVRNLVQVYGANPEDAPPYLPTGVTLPDWIVSVTEDTDK